MVYNLYNLKKPLYKIETYKINTNLNLMKQNYDNDNDIMYYNKSFNESYALNLKTKELISISKIPIINNKNPIIRFKMYLHNNILEIYNILNIKIFDLLIPNDIDLKLQEIDIINNYVIIGSYIFTIINYKL